MDVTTTTDVDADATMAPAYLEETATVGFGLSFFSHAAVDAATDSSVEATAAVVAVVQTTALTLAAIAASGLSSFSSSVAAATITVAANSLHCQWVLFEPIGFS